MIVKLSRMVPWPVTASGDVRVFRRVEAMRLVWVALTASTMVAGLATAPGELHAASATIPPARGAESMADHGSPPGDLRDLHAWLGYKAALKVVALPMEARAFYRRGMMAWKAGQDAEAVRLVRGAATLDPSFTSPHLALALWFLPREPSQALLSCATLIDLLRRNFLLQLHVVANGAFFLIHGLFFGVLFAAILVVALHQQELRHLWEERLGMTLKPGIAHGWAWALLLLPWLMGAGLALPALIFLGMLWPMLKARERVLWGLLAVLVACGPFAGGAFGRLALPLRETAGPLYGVPAVEGEPHTAARQAELTILAGQHRDNAFLQFGLAWCARRGEDLATAEAAYRRGLELWPSNDRVLNNLGNLLAIQGRFDEALEHFRQAIGVNPSNAAAHFNASQVHTRLFDFPAASDAVARASALDFEMVKTYQSGTGADGSLPLVDQWIAPATFWKALLEAPAPVNPALPPPWRSLIETSGWSFSGVALGLAALSLALGVWWQRRLPIRGCSNCSRVVCRRCARRRREIALCPECESVASRAESSEFARVLLGQQARKVDRVRRLVVTGFATLIPGFGHLAFRRVFGAIALLAISVEMVSLGLGLRTPFVYEPQIGGAAPFHTGILWIGCWAFVYAVSIIGYVSRAARASGPAGASPPRNRTSDLAHDRAQAA